MLQEGSAVSVGKFWLFGDRLHLANVPVVTCDVALVFGGVNNVGIGRIRRDVAGLAPTYVVPVFAIDGALIASAGDGDASGILL